MVLKGLIGHPNTFGVSVMVKSVMKRSDLIYDGVVWSEQGKGSRWSVSIVNFLYKMILSFFKVLINGGSLVGIFLLDGFVVLKSILTLWNWCCT